MFTEWCRMYIYLLLNDCKTLPLQREKTKNQYLVDFLLCSLSDLQALAESASWNLSNNLDLYHLDKR